MKQTFKFFVAIATIAVGMTACSSEEIISTVPTLQPTTERGSLTITINNKATTKAVDDSNAVDAEIAINKISLFIFGSATEAEADTIFTTTNPNPFTENGDNSYNATFYNAPIGSKSVYVGVNLPQGLHDDIKTKGVAAVYELKTLTELQALYPASGGFPMFSDETKSPVTTIAQKTGTEVNVDVKRFVAKVTLETSKTFEDEAVKKTANGMTVDATLKFAMGQINTKFFPFPQKVGSYYLDPNYSAVITNNTLSYATDFISGWTYDFKNNSTWAANAFDDFKEVTTSSNTSDIMSFAPAYVLENTNEQKLKGELTYALVSAKFTPEFTHSYANSQVTATTNTAKDISKLYVFNNGGTYYYFTDKTEADLYQTDKGLDYKEYTDCTCFYRVFLNPGEKYNVYRNDYYRVTVEQVVRLGEPLPELEDPTLEIGGTAALKVNIDVQQWQLKTQDASLGKD
ncbi:MAG: Mfa1 family fimbria major subunit [Tannerellaceae bacterium]|nr:Mfa1 family fimbria major subunit [Tannerellaceae bacterium]